jgi:hypothetical protein
MSEAALDARTQALQHIRKAEGYKKLGLAAQVQHELWQAQRLDPAIVQDPLYQALFTTAATNVEQSQSLRAPFRIGAVMLWVNALLSVCLTLLLLAAGETGALGQGAIIGPIVSVIMGVNLWRERLQWKRYTVIWAIIGMVIWGIAGLVGGSWIDVILQVAFGASLILLLTGIPSRGRVIASVVLYAVGYIGLLLAVLILSFLAGLSQAL